MKEDSLEERIRRTVKEELDARFGCAICHHPAHDGRQCRHPKKESGMPCCCFVEGGKAKEQYPGLELDALPRPLPSTTSACEDCGEPLPAGKVHTDRQCIESFRARQEKHEAEFEKLRSSLAKVQAWQSFIRRALGKPPPAADDPERPHIIGGEFQSDKYPTCPRGKVPLSTKDKLAQDLLWQYAQRRRKIDAKFADDLEWALRKHGFEVVAASPTKCACGNPAVRRSTRQCGDDVRRPVGTPLCEHHCCVDCEPIEAGT